MHKTSWERAASSNASIVTERARKLRAQYNLQAQGIRTRIEIRVNRIPMALRKAKMGELADKYTSGQHPLQARPTPSHSASHSIRPPVPQKDNLLVRAESSSSTRSHATTSSRPGPGRPPKKRDRLVLPQTCFQSRTLVDTCQVMKLRATARRLASQWNQRHRRRSHAPRPAWTKHPKFCHQHPPTSRPCRDPHQAASHPVCALLQQLRTHSASRNHPRSKVVCPTSLAAGRRRPVPPGRGERLRRHRRPRAQLLVREGEKSARRPRRALPRLWRLRLSGELAASARLAKAVRPRRARKELRKRRRLQRGREGSWEALGEVLLVRRRRRPRLQRQLRHRQLLEGSLGRGTPDRAGSREKLLLVRISVVTREALHSAGLKMRVQKASGI